MMQDMLNMMGGMGLARQLVTAQTRFPSKDRFGSKRRHSAGLRSLLGNPKCSPPFHQWRVIPSGTSIRGTGVTEYSAGIAPITPP